MAEVTVPRGPGLNKLLALRVLIIMYVIHQGNLIAVLRTKGGVFLLKVYFGLCVDDYLLVSYKLIPLLPT